MPLLIEMFPFGASHCGSWKVDVVVIQLTINGYLVFGNCLRGVIGGFCWGSIRVKELHFYGLSTTHSPLSVRRGNTSKEQPIDIPVTHGMRKEPWDGGRMESMESVEGIRRVSFTLL